MHMKSFVSIRIIYMHIPPQVATIILAGGQGTRLYPLTINHSKPAVSYAGRYRLIDIPISNSINSNFRQIFVIAQYLSSELAHHISQTYHFDAFNPGSIDVLTPQENEEGKKQWFAGTADAVRKNLSLLLKSPAEYFLILSGDQLYNIHFLEMVEFAKESGADLTIASTVVPKKDAKRMGLLKVDKMNFLEDFVEKPTDPEVLEKFAIDEDQYLASMGIYVFKREALVSLLEQDQRHDFGFHLIDTALKTKKTATFIHKGYWEDIGTVGSYYDANLILTKSNAGLNTYDERNPIYTRPTFLPGPKILGSQISNSIICEGSLIEAKEVTNSIIGLRSQVGKGTIIRDSIIMGNHFYMPPEHKSEPLSKEFSIGENCIIEKAIIDEFVEIKNDVKLINKKKLTQYDGDGIYIRQGIIIVPSGTHLPDGFEL